MNISDFVGKTFACVEKDGDDRIVFGENNGERFIMEHMQDCCESVFIEDVCGEFVDLVGSPILVAEEVSCDKGPLTDYDESYTWTFYKFSTIKGSVTIRWYGTSNGYYSESVDVYSERKGRYS